MATQSIKTINLLPEFLRTNKNAKFLSSTIDQWIQPPELERIDGYVGSKITPTFNSTSDVYISDNLPLRSDYQLEPAVVIKDSTGSVQGAVAFDDLVNEISTKGGINNNFDRLFRSKFYSYDPNIDWDKLINYSEYYWLVTGPEVISIIGQPTNTTSTYKIADNEINSALVFTPNGFLENPVITLYRGNTYNFDVSSVHTVYIKTDSSSGTSDALTYNITGNGASTGTITIVVDQYTPDTLYYVASDQQGIQGKIIVKNPTEDAVIDVDEDLIGKKNYRSGNGVNLSNGMKIKFDGKVIPSSYQNKEYWVEGVGDAIKLIDYNLLTSSESMASVYDENFDATPFDEYPFDNFKTLPLTPEYITINRASRDLNPWSRYNRWVHADVIQASADANGTVASFPSNLRAQRPIVEFKADLKLFNFGTVGMSNVDLIDNITTDAFSIVEGSAGYYVDGVLLEQGHRVIFNADADPTVKGKIYQVNYVTNSKNRTRLVLAPAENFTSLVGYSVGVNLGDTNKGTSWWFNGTSWQYSQQHNQLNQAPLFDLFDSDGNSYSDASIYQSNFAGTKVFGYDEGAGTPDKILGFPLNYRNSVGVGSYLFKNYFTTDTISVSINNSETITVPVSETYLNFSYETGNVYKNVWTTSVDYVIPIQQFQTITTATFSVEINAIDNPQSANFSFDVLVNNNKLASSNYTTKIVNQKFFVVFNRVLPVGTTVLFRIYTDVPANSNGFYEVPLGLTNNPLNGPIASFTLSELSDHLGTAVARYKEFSGSFPGAGNLRDVSNIASYGDRLISNANPMPFAHLFIGKKEHSVIDAIEKVGDQYNQFKMAFLNKLLTVDNQTDYVNLVDSILLEINQNKNLQSPYYFSDMVAYGNDKITRSWTVTNPNNTVYPISSSFDPTVLSTRSVLVYVNDTQLILNKDYEFVSNDSSVNIMIDLAVGDQLLINDYTNTEGSYVPPTPTKLGLYPKFEPKIYVDNTYVTPTTVIQGHDGSIMVAYNDFRDNIILELEKRIYNNIKASYRQELLDVQTIIPGLFRKNEYTNEEINSVLSFDFLRWAGFYGIEYNKNSTFNESDPFTWNYTGSYNATFGVPLTGSWRSVYKLFYDTDRPHTCPWEMLGFTVKPAWWEQQYGPAPYTSGNELLWNDLEEGVIRDPMGDTKNSLYARPGLKNILPVDESGNLVDPTVLVASEITTYNIRQDWIIGDISPAETAWRRSSYWPFAVQRLMALVKPADYASLMYDPTNMVQNKSGQWSYLVTGSFLNPKNVPVFEGTSNLTSGYSVFVVEAGKQRDLNYVKSLTNDLEYFNINLFHKVGGFVNKNNLQIVIDAYEPNSTGPGALLPQENYNLFLNVSNPVNSVGISGIIIQRSSGKFVVKGYDRYNPYFKTFTPTRNNNTPTLTVGGISSPYVTWQASGDSGSTGLNAVDTTTAKSASVGKFYKKGQIVSYGNRYYMVTVDHMAESVFNTAYYQSLPSLPTTGGVTVTLANGFNNTVTQVPYGTIFNTVQEVYDFIIGYGSWLISQGFIFDEYNNDLNAVLDWNFSGKEFLYWSTQNWADGSVITLSPFAEQLKFQFKESVVDNVFDSFYDYSILQENGFAFPKKNLDVARDNGVCTIRSVNTPQGIYFAQLNSVQKEHGMVFDNTTVFNDVIYDIETGYRQRRVQLIGFRTANWDGDYFTPGFVYDTAVINDWNEYTDYLYGDVVRFNSKYYSAIQDVPGTDKFDFTKWAVLGKKPVADLISNFDYKINQFEDFYSLDIDNFDTNQQQLAQHLTGYTPRVYLNNIFINPIAQYKFYQGFIREKGTKNAITKLSKASIENLQGSITFNEEWAFRIGNYGSFETYQEIEFPLVEGTFGDNPQAISLVDSIPSIPNDLVIYNTPLDLVIVPKDYVPSNSFVTTSTVNFELATAGYVRLDDVTATAYNESSILDISDNSKIQEGNYIWLGFKDNNDWDILRYERVDVGITGVEVTVPTVEIQFTTNLPHKLNVGDIVSITQLDSQVNGIYRVTSIPTLQTFAVASTLMFISTFEITSPGLLFKFNSVRYKNFDSIPNDQQLFKLPVGSKLWVDEDNNGNWAVYEKVENYKIASLTTNTSVSAHGWNICKVKGDRILIESAPWYTSLGKNDVGTIFVKDAVASTSLFNYNFNQNATTEFYKGTTHTEFGQALYYDNNSFNNTGYGLFFVGAPGTSDVKNYSSGPLKTLGIINTAPNAPSLGLVQQGAIKISSVDPVLITEVTQAGLMSPSPSHYERFGQSIYVQKNVVSNKAMLVGAPGVNGLMTGTVYNYSLNVNTATVQLTYNGAITAPQGSYGSEWGYSISGSKNASYVAISAPGWFTATGYVAVYSENNSGFTNHQIISSPFGIRSRFGNSVTVTEDAGYLLVTAPEVVNEDKSIGGVVVYKLVNGIYELEQIITNPIAGAGMKFGIDADINSDSNEIVISALGLDRKGQVFDTHLTTPTTFDLNTTFFNHSVENSGSVYTYTRKNNRFVFAEEINPGDLTTSTNFGQSILVDSDIIYIGAPNTGLNSEYSAVFNYQRMNKNSDGWDTLRSFDNLVDVSNIQRVSLIDTFNEELVEYLDVIDPAKGKVAGIAEQELKYKSAFDPAVYSLGTTSTVVDLDINWLNENVGNLWWDLSTVKYVWYEQGDATYRKNNWGATFPGSSIDVYEWVESTYLPSEWSTIADTPAGLSMGISGQPKYPDNTVLSVKQVYNSLTNSFGNVYYYWVKNKVTVPVVKNRRLSAAEVSRVIADPTGYGLIHANIISENALALSNVSPLLVGDRINVNIAFDVINNQIPKHTEWLLLQEGSPSSVPNTLLEKKLLDSLLGHDTLGTAVPDPSLSPRARYGIGIRPQQTMFKDRQAALRNLINFTNSVLAKNIITGQYNFSNLTASEEIPSVYTHAYDRPVEDNESLLVIDTRKLVQAKLSCAVSNGRIIQVTIDEPGFGYEISPTVTVVGNGKVEAVISTEIDSSGRVVGINIDNAGSGYVTAPTLEVRPYTVIVQADNAYNGKWTSFIWRSDLGIWVREHTQRYNTSLYWEYINWSSSDYNQYQDYTYSIDSVYQLYTLTDIIAGQYVKVKNGGDGNYIILNKLESGNPGTFGNGYDIVYKQNGTIQILDLIWSNTNSTYGFDQVASYDQTLYDQTPDLELQYILSALKNDIFINQLKVNWNLFFFKAVKYALTEQKLLDWAFKTSFINVINTAGSLDQRPVYKLQNTQYFEDYISEVKPYHSQIRSFTTNYSLLENSSNYNTDFDLPPYFDTTTNQFNTISDGSDLLNQYPWKSWADNNSFGVGSIAIGNPGNGYTVAPTVSIKAQPGDLGAGATAIAFITSGEVSLIEVTNPGSGYMVPPVITINGGGSTSLTTATAYAQLYNGKVRTNKIGMKFDRFNRSNQIGNVQTTDSFICNGINNSFVLNWLAEPNKNNITVLLDKVRVLSADYTISYYTEEYNGYKKKYCKIVFLNYVPANNQILTVTYRKSTELFSALERVENYYNPNSGMPGNTATQVMSGLEYPKTQIQGLSFAETADWDVLFGSSTYSPFGTSSYNDNISYYQTLALASTATVGTNVLVLSTTTGLKAGQYVNITNTLTNVFATPTAYIESVNATVITEIKPISVTSTENGTTGTINNVTSFNIDATTATSQIQVGCLCSVTGYNDPFTVTSIVFDGGLGYTVVLNGGTPFTLTFPISFYRPASTTYSVTVNSTTTETINAGSTVEFWSYDSNSNRLDSAIDGGTWTPGSQGPVLIDALGINPEDITIDGDGFYTPNTGYAPEELVAGQVTESIGINVYTKNPNGAPLVFSRSFDIVAGVETIQPLSMLPTNVDSITVIFNRTIFEYNQDSNFTSANQFTIDWANQDLIISAQTVSGKASYRILGIGGGNPNTLAGVLDKQTITVDNDSRAEVISLASSSDVLSAYVTVNGVSIPEDTTGLSYILTPASEGNKRASVIVSNLPSGTSTVQAWFFGTDVSYYNEVQEQVFTVGSTPQTTFVLASPPGTIEPADAQIIVEIAYGENRRQLLPPYVSYYQVTDVNDRTFTIDNHVVRPPATYSLTTVRVYQNGVALMPGFDFQVNINDNTVTVYPNILKQGDAIAVLGLVGQDYDYDVVSNILTVPLRSGIGVSNAQIKVITYTDQDGMLMRTERFPGVANNRYQISRPALNLNYVWVSLNGIPLSSGIDYDVLDDGVTVQLADSFVTNSTDNVVITTISSNQLASTVLGYRIFSDIFGRMHYKRLSKQNTTYLTQPLSYTDTEIHVADATVLTPPILSAKSPGIVLIDSERIEFLEVNGNVLSKLRRGTLGTAPAFYSDINTKVIDQSPTQTVPYSEKVNKQTLYTSANLSTYVISTATIDAVNQGITFVGNSVDASNQIAVYYGGRQLKKSSHYLHDTTISYDSPPGLILGTTSTVYGLPLTTTVGNAYVVTATNQVWVYTGSVEVNSVNGYVYQGLKYLPPEFSINTSTNALMLNIENGVQDNIELVVVQKQYNQTANWTNTGTSLMNSTTAPAKFLQERPAELPDSWYYGGDTELLTSSGEPLTDVNQEPLQGL
jgi:hypothetical protein